MSKQVQRDRSLLASSLMAGGSCSIMTLPTADQLKSPRIDLMLPLLSLFALFGLLFR